jgi:predicted enzyme related to lactoylglutathione lyase
MGFEIKSFTTIRISVTNVTESKNWYQSLFGQKPIEEIENFVSFKINDTCFDISLADSKSPFSTGGSVGYWLVDDMNELLRRVEEIGGKIYRGPLRIDEIQRTIVQIQDPFGNVIGFEAPF